MDLAIDPNTSPLDPDSGKLVAVAQAQAGAVEVVRYNTNGTLDTGFGSNQAGYVTLSGLTYPAVTVQADDRIVVAGTVSSTVPGTPDAIGLDRLTADGTPDASFGTNGVVLTSGPTAEVPRSVAIQANGQILVGGAQVPATNRDTFLVARYNADGSPDGTFGAGGIATGGSANSGNMDMALEPDGGIVLAGYTVVSSQTVFSLARFLAA